MHGLSHTNTIKIEIYTLTNFKALTKRIVGIVVIAQLAYLLIINTALHLSITQDLVNKIKPEKFQVSWERAWSFYPFRVHAEGIVANGQSRTQQWEVLATSGSGSIALLPLVLKEVYISDIEATDIDYRQRPRLKPERDYSQLLAYFPPITGREVVPVETTPLKSKRPWKIHLSGLQAQGNHRFWVFNIQGTASGSATGDMYMETRRGKFWLDVANADLNLGPAYLNGSAQAYKGGTLQGALGFTPLIRSEHRGKRMLRFGYTDVQLDVGMENFNFINIFTTGLGDLDITGAGQVEGRLVLRDGYVRAGTQLKASANNLGVTIRDVDISGQGTVLIHTPADADSPMGLSVGYESLRATEVGASEPFLKGNTLRLDYSGSNYIYPDPDKSFQELWADDAARKRRAMNTFNLLINDATVIDMATFNRYLPPESPYTFAGGTTRLDANIAFGEESMNGAIQLDSTAVKIQVDEQSFEADIDADIAIPSGIPREFKANLSGSTLRLFNVRVDGNEENFDGDYWSAALELTSAEGTVQQPLALDAKATLSVSDTRPLVAFVDNKSNPPKFLSNLMAVKDLSGEAEVHFSNGKTTIPLAYVNSEKAEVAVKATFYDGERDGVAYARFKKLDALLKRENGKRKVVVTKSREKFDQYEIPKK